MPYLLRIRRGTQQVLGAAVGVPTVIFLACGSKVGSHERLVTVGKYRPYEYETITVVLRADIACNADARSVAREASNSVRRFGSTAASSTDVYYDWAGVKNSLTSTRALAAAKGLSAERLAGS